MHISNSHCASSLCQPRTLSSPRADNPGHWDPLQTSHMWSPEAQPHVLYKRLMAILELINILKVSVTVDPDARPGGLPISWSLVPTARGNVVSSRLSKACSVHKLQRRASTCRQSIAICSLRPRLVTLKQPCGAFHSKGTKNWKALQTQLGTLAYIYAISHMVPGQCDPIGIIGKHPCCLDDQKCIGCIN